MKKTQLFAVTALTTLMAVTGCGKKTDNRIKIEWKSTFSYEEQINSLIEDFEKENPDIHVVYTKLSSDYTGLKDNVISGIGANNLPNIVSCYPDHIAEYLDYGIVQKLDNYMNSDEDYGWSEEDYADMLPSLMAPCSNFASKGTYMLPHSSSTEAMFYNEQILGLKLTYQDADGVEHKINGDEGITHSYLNNITWEELLGVVAPALLKYNAEHQNALLKVGETDHSAVVAYSGADNAFVTFCEEQEQQFSEIDKSTGNGKLLFNDTRVMKDTLKQFNGYYRDRLFTTAGIEGEKNLNCNENFWAIFATGSTGGIKYQVPKGGEFSTGVMRLPNFAGKPHKVISQGPGLCVLKTGTDEQKLASYKFINFLNQPENTLYWSLETGYFPVRSSCYLSDQYIDACNTKGKAEASLELLKAKVFTYASTVQNDFFTNVPFKGSADARTYVGSLFNKCVGQKTAITDSMLDTEFANTINEIKKKMA